MHVASMPDALLERALVILFDHILTPHIVVHFDTLLLVLKPGVRVPARFYGRLMAQAAERGLTGTPDQAKERVSVVQQLVFY